MKQVRNYSPILPVIRTFYFWDFRRKDWRSLGREAADLGSCYGPHFWAEYTLEKLAQMQGMLEEQL